MTELHNFKTLSEQQPEILDNLLTGNGFSRHFYDKFSYGSLYNFIKEQGKLEEKESKIFDDFKTANFEFVLNSLQSAMKINNIFNLSTHELNESYKKIKNLLIEAVNGIHPRKYRLKDANELAWSFYIFKKNIFTTNYDLLSYWAITEIFATQEQEYIGDYFKGYPLVFSPEQFNDFKMKVHYLHGALHLFDFDGDIGKIKTSSQDDILTTVTKMYSDDKFPIYVAEGSFREKLIQIKRNRYLNYCYERLREISGGITIIGQSLSEDYDKHIIDAINTSPVKHIAYGVYATENDPDTFIVEKIKRLFRKKELHFFDSHTYFDELRKIAEQQKDYKTFGYHDTFPKLPRPKTKKILNQSSTV
ncbi:MULTISPECIES: DUF4917 family protein [Bacillus]|nr:DUF4917 family protein [Bacillus subtilis]MEC1488862.1 DUF4917 family protein [Bacillus subtilis]WOO45337.1 DUF4917 family protein [Bacillus subtilis]